MPEDEIHSNQFQVDETITNNEKNPNDRKRLGMKWYHEYFEMKDREICIPNIEIVVRKAIKVGLQDLFKLNLTPLIKELSDYMNYQGEPLELRKNILIGVLEHCMQEIRKHIMIKLNKAPSLMYKRRPKNHYKPGNINNELIDKNRCLGNYIKLKDYLVQFYSLMDDDLDATTRNRIERVNEKILKFCFNDS